VESELFGHEKGAFTSADHRHVGKFEQASGGSLFLDEIGELSPASQAKLLRVLQDQRFERLGGEQTIETDVRVIAATNKNLEALVREGRFREDLFYRLDVCSIHLPPLRERGKDVSLLIDHFLRVCSRDCKKAVPLLSDEARRLLEGYPWPGNVRELENAIRHALVYATSHVLTPSCLPDRVRHKAGAGSGTDCQSVPPGSAWSHAANPVVPSSAADTGNLDAFVQRLLESGESKIYDRVGAWVDARVLAAVLRHTGGNKTRAGELLGLSRTTLQKKLEAAKVDKRQAARPDSGQTVQILDGDRPNVGQRAQNLDGP
jgi:two-component system nitrogen regulation response regulator GlnG